MTTNSNKTIPFILEVEKESPIWTMVADGQNIYAGTGSDGIVLKSSDRAFWSELLTVEDVHVKSLYIVNNKLFIGTSPRGIIYIYDLSTEILSISQELGGEIYSFISYKDNIYAAGGNPTNIYIYNTYKNRWDINYTPYSNIVTKMLIFDGLMYVFFDDKNFISFDGSVWTLQKYGLDNISSISNVINDPYSENNDIFLDRANVKGAVIVNNLDDEEIYDIFPINYSRGIKSADIDGGALVIGTSEYGRVYNYFHLSNASSNFMIQAFQTESGNTVHYLLNIDIGVNLAAIDNKLYLVYCGNVISTSTTTTVTSSNPSNTNTTTTLMPNVVVITPMAGQQFATGDTVNITWSSNKGINDAMSIELYSDGVLNQSINDKTTNSGSYDWQIPNNIFPSDNFQIVINWLSNSSVQDSLNTGKSGIFSISAIAPTSTTSTTTVPSAASLGLPQTDDCRGIPLLDLPFNEYITCMMKDVAMGGILMSTSFGRILGCSTALINSYLTGDRNVYAEVKNGFGNISNTVWTSLFYSLYNKIAEINEDNEIVKWKYQKDSTAIVIDRITGVFLSPILYVKEDLDIWKQLIWKEDKQEDTEIVICIRSADDPISLQSMPWDYCFTSRDSDREYGSSNFIIRELGDYQIKGKYLQFRVIMTSDKNNVTPTLLSLMITYSTKFASYFYTTRFELKSASAVKSGFIMANMTIPQNTEVKFGISPLDSSNWEDYSIVDPNTLFTLNSIDYLKIGIKMITYDESVPEVAEFALLTGSDKDNEINRL